MTETHESEPADQSTPEEDDPLEAALPQPDEEGPTPELTASPQE